MKPVFRRSLTALPDLHLDELAAHCVDVMTDERPGFADDEYGQLIEADCAIGAIGISRQVCQSHTFKGVAVYIFIENVFPSWFLMSQPTKARSPSSDFAMK